MNNNIINQNQPVKIRLADYINWRTCLGAALLIAAAWVLIFMKIFTATAIYLIVFSLGVLSLSFLISGVKLKK